MASATQPIDEKTTPQDPGSISYCPYQGCGFRCCEFQQGNFIALYPGEVEDARARGASLAHLEFVETYYEGHKVVCRAQDTSCCDGGYKPLDCQSYPFFPTVDAETGTIRADLKGAKCPLTSAMLPEHQAWVREVWELLSQRRPDVRAWLSRVHLVGYETVQDPAKP